MRHLISAAGCLLLALAPMAAQAQDAAVCDALNIIMPGANSGFNGVKRDKTDKNIWAVAVNLPYAHECELRYDRDDKSYAYACYFRVDPSRNAKVEMSNYADNVAACRPDWTRYHNDEGDYMTVGGSQGEVAFSWNDSYPTEFNIYIEAAEQ